MDRDSLVQRRKWFRVFPEGTLEFNVITRVLALMMLMALAIVGGMQRSLVLVGLLGILWFDYILLLWWAIQVSVDLGAISGSAQVEISSSRRAWIGLKAALPSIAAVVALLPWGTLLSLVSGGAHTTFARVLQVVAALTFLGLLPVAYRALRSISLGSPAWTMLFLIPLLHFFALHRIASSLNARLGEQLESRGEERPHAGASASLVVADITWVLSVLPWVLIIGVVLVRGWPTSGAFKAGPVCGTILGALFAIANLAAMEAVQRRLVTLIRKV